MTEDGDSASTCDLGRGPRAGTVESVLPVAFRLLLQEGSGALTPQRLFTETGVARTTIYRHWPTSSDLILALLKRATSTDGIEQFTGNLETDLGIAVGSLVFRFNNRPVRALFGALLDEGRGATIDSNDEVDEASFIRGVLAPINQALREAVDRGDLTLDDIDQATLELAGPLLTQHVLLGETVTEADGTNAASKFLAQHRQA